MTAFINSVRRYYLLKRFAAKAKGDDIELVWKSKQEAVPEAALPPSFPLLQRLTALGYSTDADLDGADEAELTKHGFSSDEAQRILAALASL
jgi:hypothetical protein